MIIFNNKTITDMYMYIIFPSYIILIEIESLITPSFHLSLFVIVF